MTPPRPCPRCGSSDQPLMQPAKPPHHQEARCSTCGGHLQWVAKPGNHSRRQGARRRQPGLSGAELAALVPEHRRHHCEKCGITAAELEVGGGHLETHHRLARRHGGTDDPGNLQRLCVNCHQAHHGIDGGRRAEANASLLDALRASCRGEPVPPPPAAPAGSGLGIPRALPATSVAPAWAPLPWGWVPTVAPPGPSWPPTPAEWQWSRKGGRIPAGAADLRH